MGDFWNQQGVDNKLRFQDYAMTPNERFPDQPYMNIQQSPVSSFNNDYQLGSKNLYQTVGGTNFEDEPPLMEELGIEPDKILKRMLLVLDPFRSSIYLEEYDLMGPLILCMMLPSVLVLSGKTYFNYVYGFGTISSVLMYLLLKLMSQRDISPSTATSILGYGLLPQIILAVLGIIMPLYSIVGLALAMVCIIWSSYATSRILATMMNSKEMALIAYPCGLLYSVFTLLVLF